MNNKTIHFEMIHPGFDDESNYLDAIQVTALLEYCIFVLLIQQFGTENTCEGFISGNNFENNR